ncbi:hypothetical protein MBM_00644 [Drepanopeziza brunnea f. sp. 'multigermtubi' MB_m1]|uniref:Uncharacterized protein n=1 Tax=Marssonina brunnea f. sp. multigermtubi (strain MB_m1) TaxID=1072389 RepID=K1X8V6_MARBU|nr:uncharacterized protein MBM_00644 [Drepanopeziza brunnea f. sp. 'multigermtubi' MB_m1]EKD21531.1 hypothetical protein MBM_00644 [Drepanopeziza brunnea f. sp. 'multigermtubi' MB_m1]
MKSISPALFAPLATAGVINPVKIGNIDTARLLSWQTQTPCPPPPTLQPHSALDKVRSTVTSQTQSSYPTHPPLLPAAEQCYTLADPRQPDLVRRRRRAGPSSPRCSPAPSPRSRAAGRGRGRGRRTDGARDLRWSGNADVRTVGIDDSIRCGVGG